MALARVTPIRREEAERPTSPRRPRSVWRDKLVNIIMSEEEHTRRMSDAFMLPEAQAMQELEEGDNQDKEYPATFRNKMNSVLDPSSIYTNHFGRFSHKVTLCVHVCGFVAIVVSVCLVLIESMPRYYGKHLQSLFVVETVCVVFFTVEFGSRLYSTDSRVKFMYDFLNWIDLLSIVPYYLGFFIKSDQMQSLIFLRCIRLVKVLRVLKVGKISENLQYVQKSLTRSLDALYLLFFLIIISMVLFSSAMFLAETSSEHLVEGTWYTKHVDHGATENVESKFQSIPHTFWWALVTLCTVGYGDLVPLSYAGRGVAAVTMLAGTLVIAFPVILIGANFNEIVFEKQNQNAKRTSLHTLLDLRILTTRAVSEFANGLQSSSVHDRASLPNTILTSILFEGINVTLHSVGAPDDLFISYTYSPLMLALGESIVDNGSLISFHLVLDSVALQEAAVDAICALPNVEEPEACSVFMRGVSKMYLNLVCDLAEVTLLTTECYNPTHSVLVSIHIGAIESLARLLSGEYPNVSLEAVIYFEGTKKNEPDLEVSVEFIHLLKKLDWHPEDHPMPANRTLEGLRSSEPTTPPYNLSQSKESVTTSPGSPPLSTGSSRQGIVTNPLKLATRV